MKIIIDKPVRDFEFSNSTRIVERLIQLQQENNIDFSRFKNQFGDYLREEKKRNKIREKKYFGPQVLIKTDLKQFFKLEDEEIIKSKYETLELVRLKLHTINSVKEKEFNQDAQIGFYASNVNPNYLFIKLYDSVKLICSLLKPMSGEDLTHKWFDLLLHLDFDDPGIAANEGYEYNGEKDLVKFKNRAVKNIVYYFYYWKIFEIENIKNIFLDNISDEDRNLIPIVNKVRSKIYLNPIDFNIAGIDKRIDQQDLNEPIFINDFNAIIDIFNNYIISNLEKFYIELFPPTENNKNNKKKNISDPTTLNLKTMIKGERVFDYIMNLLIEKSIIEPKTYVWKDSYSKNYAAFLIKNLFVKGYYNTGKNPTTIEIIEIAKNSFSLELSKRTITGTSVGKYDSDIPTCDELLNKLDLA